MDEMVPIAVTKCERATSASSMMRRVVTRAIETTRQVLITTLKDILRVATTSEAISMTRRVISRVVLSIAGERNCRAEASSASLNVCLGIETKLERKTEARRG